VRALLRRLRCDEVGAYAVVEMLLGVGLLLFPTIIVLAQVPGMLERNGAANLAAQEAARAMVLADDEVAGEEAGVRIARSIVANHGLDPDAVSVEFVLDPPVGELVRGGTVTARVEIGFPIVTVPLVGPLWESFTITREHTERVDDFRSFP
jgi:hypothetical protein